MAVRTPPSGVELDDPDFVQNPVTGEQFLFHTHADDPGTDAMACDIWTPPGMTPLAEHVHPNQPETFTIHDGTIQLSIGGTVESYTTGDGVTIPAGTPHTWWNAGTDVLHVTIQFEPGLSMEEFLCDLATLAHRGEVDANGKPSFLQIAALYDAYGFDDMYLASPPLFVQRAIFGLFAPVAKRLGYRGKPVPRRSE